MYKSGYWISPVLDGVEVYGYAEVLYDYLIHVTYIRSWAHMYTKADPLLIVISFGRHVC